MIYVLFIDNLPDSIAAENDAGDVRGFEGELEFEEAWPEYLHIIPIVKKPEFNLDHKKRVAVREIEKAANEYQSKIIGTTDSLRAERFKLNLLAAHALISSTATAEQTAMLQNQLDANVITQHPQITGMSLNQFAQWIVNFEKIAVLGSGLIEKVLILGRAAIWNAESSAEIAQIKANLRAQAESEFAALLSG